MNPLASLGYAANPAYLENMTTHSEVYWDGPAHQKITHGIGGHAKAHFKWNNNSYSGMFQQADSCVIRMANAAEPVHGTAYNPNLAIKCYRSDGMESANIQTLWEIDGYNVLPPNRTKSCSMFGAPLSNHCGYRDNINKPLKDYFIKDFDKVSPRSMWIGASQLAVGTQDGVAVAPKHTNFPFALVFDPAPGAADTECTFSNYTSQLYNLGPDWVGKGLYEVYAVKDPWMDRPAGKPDIEHIGSLVLDSAFTTSLYGDTQLFFRHVFWETELALMQQVDVKRWNLWDAYAKDAEWYKEEGAAWYQPFLPYSPHPVPPACTNCLGLGNAWCYMDNQCHAVGSAFNPCSSAQCCSSASLSACTCASCSDATCRKA
jgi:hypothetical protein